MARNVLTSSRKLHIRGIAKFDTKDQTQKNVPKTVLFQFIKIFLIFNAQTLNMNTKSI